MDSTLVFNFGIGIVIILFVFFVLCMSGVQKGDFGRLFIHTYVFLDFRNTSNHNSYRYTNNYSLIHKQEEEQ